MKKKLWILSFLMAMVFLMAGASSSFAAVFGGDGTGSALKTVLNNITTIPAGASSVNVKTDELSDASDSLWAITGVGASANTLVIELAAWATTNKFGVYDAYDPTKQVEIFSGSDAAGDQAFLSIKLDGSVWINNADNPGNIDFAGNLFGYYLDATMMPGAQGPVANPDGGFWYSDSALNTADNNWDHMYAYQGAGTDTIQLPNLAAGLWTDNEFLLAWEDLSQSNSGHNISYDGDYTDFVVMVESVGPAAVPIPSALLLLSSGLMGFIGFRRKFRS